MKIFAASIYASITIDGVIRQTVHTSVVIRSANSLAEAKMVAIGIMLDRWPKKDGWNDHSEEIVEIQIVNPMGNI